jgi:acetyl esterase/lipase
MPVNTLSVSAAVTPVVIQTYLSHYLNRRPLAQKPTAHISYHEGLELIRRFLRYASFHTVDELQAFTSQWVPVPHWVHVKVVEITNAQLLRSAEIISAQLGPKGIQAVGGEKWWQWRRDGTVLNAEWIEMRKDYDARKQLNITKGDRIMLYVHGGAYFFGSVDEHRYQMQRHARKLKARVIAPKYRLAPQFPFPCGLHDCLAVYLHLLDEKHDPNTIILAGDSAGGGMVLSMLVALRDQGIPLPAGAILISPWVDLTHSFPSLNGDDKMDYIPAHGFVHKPSESWRECVFLNA